MTTTTVRPSNPISRPAIQIVAVVLGALLVALAVAVLVGNRNQPAPATNTPPQSTGGTYLGPAAAGSAGLAIHSGAMAEQHFTGGRNGTTGQAEVSPAAPQPGPGRTNPEAHFYGQDLAQD
jgi:hypothetical protein